MKIHWKTPSPPELAGLPEKERKRIWRECVRQGNHRRRVWIGALLLGACAGIGSPIGEMFGHGIVGAMIGGGIGGFLFSQFSIHSALEVLRERYPVEEAE